jgi:hypothetical protein
MDEIEYNRIVKNVDKEEKYVIKEGLLYRIKKSKIMRVIRKYEFEGLMFMMHNHELAAHFGIKATQEKVKERYYWKNMLKDIEVYVKSCDNCQRRGKPVGKNELHPIKVKEPFYQIGIDFVGPLPITESGNRYIIVAMDYFTKWPEAKAVKVDNAKEVAKFIYEEIICRHGCPEKILSDRGTHFNNKMIEELMDKFEIKHRFSTSYHPKTNGLVERFNKTLCESLAKLGGNKNWDDKIAPVLFAYRNKRQESTKLKPFYLTYGREARLPVDNEDIQKERFNQLIEELPRVRNQAKEEIDKSQIKQKKYHDGKNRRKELFQIGDKILLYNAAKEKQWSGKLEEKWKGPYYIHEVLLNGAYKLKELDGRIFKTPVNGELLKRYYSRENFEPMVVI